MILRGLVNKDQELVILTMDKDFKAFCTKCKVDCRLTDLCPCCLQRREKKHTKVEPDLEATKIIDNIAIDVAIECGLNVETIKDLLEKGWYYRKELREPDKWVKLF